MSEIVAIIALVGALFGATLNSIRAYMQAPETEPFNFRKLGGGLLASLLPALAVVNFGQLDQLAGLGLVALFVTQALAGAGASTMMAQAHREKKTG